MREIILFSLPDHTSLANTVADKTGLELGAAEHRRFPDGESYLRIMSDVNNKNVVLLCSLDNPDSKILPLMFMAQTLKELGANKICLAIPYLPYMRQDKRFHPGEAVTSVLFANYLSAWADSLITIDPHLHRFHNLDDIYSMGRTIVLHATSEIAQWIKANVVSPILIGPDEESKQWVEKIARQIDIPFVICKKIRTGDREVTVSIPQLPDTNSIPVLVDDIISSGASMMATLQRLNEKGIHNGICVGVHALFDSKTERKLLEAGARKIITCNTVPHETNQIDISGLIAAGVLDIAGLHFDV